MLSTNSTAEVYKYYSYIILYYQCNIDIEIDLYVVQFQMCIQWTYLNIFGPLIGCKGLEFLGILS